ncbi:hypothetical protein [Mucilaginibacter polytrichastri]|uniref:Uncharacterized protein n=1 Tax=Mucilaginibacter polytrichastri TaxID=1302689 RepID=A0A1Q6A6Q5_9SPHI|nr:hypothetical protein [Mucilaginibacter polytrichastri]OKS89662.1 hypothetical protein RG47T_5147 [Mucilaginibacter polytrichastri]SFT24853.1 hypothetical protein SAMN04487890_12252 [Mucilaginibacter polytrichastri]
MHAFLTRLGVRSEVQEFFAAHYHSDANGNLIFPYGNDTEHFGFAFHRVPDTEMLWLAGNSNSNMIRRVFICASAMEAIAYLSVKYAAFNNVDGLLFAAVGAKPSPDQISWLTRNFAGRMFTLVFGKDILARVCELKVAAGLSNIPVAIFLEGEFIIVNYRYSNYVFPVQAFSLNAFEKKTGCRFRIATQKPPGFDSYLQQLKAGKLPDN